MDNLNTATALALFLVILSWFLSYYRNPAIRLTSAVLLLISGFAAEAAATDVMHHGGEIFLFIANFAIMIAFFGIGIGEFNKMFYILFQHGDKNK